MPIPHPRRSVRTFGVGPTTSSSSNGGIEEEGEPRGTRGGGDELPVPRHCCCLHLHVKMATCLVAVISLFFIISNFLAKICGYSEIGWNFELLFLVIDGVAVLSMIYGICMENAASLQPFVMLSIITISLLASLAAYLGTAMLDTNSFAGQELELELNKRLSDAAKRLGLEFKFMVSLVASLAFVAVLLSLFIHFWFAYVTVQCAKFFRGRQCPENDK